MKLALKTLLTINISHEALADTCFTSFEKDSAEADIIFVGKLIDANYGVYWEGGSPTSVYTFEILESFKGLSKWRTVTSVMSPIYGCCSPHFKMDSTFLVFAFAFDEGRTACWTNDCTLTDLLSNSEEFYSRLGDPIKPESSSDDIELFNERKALLLQEELKKTDSINQLQNSLNINLTEEKHKNSYLTIGLIILGIVTSILIMKILVVSRKP